MAAPLQTFSAPLERCGVGETGSLTGSAAAWGHENANGVVFERGAFSDWLGAGNRPALLWQHDETQPIGVVESVNETRDGLEFSAALNLETSRGREAHALLKQGALTGVSMGVMPTASEPRDGVRHITAGELWELSLVTFPAERTARVATVSAVTSRPNWSRLIRARHAALTNGGSL